MSTVSLQKWGNSQGIRIPKNILDFLGWKTDEKLLMLAEEDRIIIKLAKEKKDIEVLFENFEGDYEPTEIDWGKPTGKEIW